MPGDDAAYPMIGGAGRFICAVSNMAGAIRHVDCGLRLLRAGRLELERRRVLLPIHAALLN
jgi:hypothetical protein